MNRCDKRIFECSMADAGRIIGRSGQSVARWRRKAAKKIHRPNYKRFKDWEIFFERDIIKQKKGYQQK